MVSRRRFVLGWSAAVGLVGLAGASAWALTRRPPDSAIGVGQTAQPRTPAGGMPLPDGTVVPVDYRSRQDWGAPEGWRNWPAGPEEWSTYPGITDYLKLRYTRREPQTITVHHTSGVSPATPAASVDEVMWIYDFDAIQREWGDLGYNLLIDPQGVVYEGRSNGFLNGRRVSPWPIFGPPGQERLMTTGAHILDFNTGNIGICVLGDFEPGSGVRAPTAAQREALVTVIAALVDYCRIDPLATVYYFNPVPLPDETDPTQAAEPLQYRGLRVNTISGHRDWAFTTCPGGNLYAMLGQIRTEVAARLPQQRS